MSGVALAAVFLALPDPRLAVHLAAWEKAAKDISNVKAVFELTRTDAVFKKERKFTGAFLHLRPRSTRIRPQSTDTQNDYDAYICDGKRLYVYNGLGKTVTEIPLRDEPGNDRADSPDTLFRLFFGRLIAGAVSPDANPVFAPLVGVPAGVKTGRYQVSLFKEDTHYVYLDIRPRTSKDQVEFAQLRMALYGPKTKEPHLPYTPAQVHLTKPNGDTELWTFTEVRHNLPDIDPAKFQFEHVPGYTLQKAQTVPPAGKKP
ncbi:MAG: TIGR03009 domain-containing protein [Gemmataceae bacterium]|nr:TIGR03009 domain-containing protein [Gemmataceae bacterium]